MSLKDKTQTHIHLKSIEIHNNKRISLTTPLKQ